MGTELQKGYQRPALLGCIQGLLNQSPDDGQILKKLIQNADDAGAETVRFLLDERTHVNDVKKFSHPGLAQFQGPALYVYNDAVFTEHDWMGICKMQSSLKLGHFGLQSIFHVTDLPAILSGDYVGFIDPHEQYLPKKTAAYAWHLANDAKEIRGFWSQFKPLSQVLFDSETFQGDQQYGHTLFRFPLRPFVSELSKKIYTPALIDKLFDSLVVDEGQSLLCLNSVTKIEIYKQKASQSEPVLMHRVSINALQKQGILGKRSKFLEEFSNVGFCLASSDYARKTASDGMLSGRGGVNYVDPSILKEVCDARSMRSDVSRRVNIGGLGMDACGQSEPLTRRLHSIIEGYTDGLAFITEMIQNADDAGATEVRLIYDKRTNEQYCTKILNPSMRVWQGPAFWVYNDAKFTDDDFRNIAKLNGATKKEMLEKIGTFGLGFNAVYNVTDLPSFLSGEHMVIFDPHTTYLNEALVDKTVPGIKFRVTNSMTNLLHTFSDQFAPWNGVCDCNLKPDGNNFFDGTLFRIPFRGEAESFFSEISNTVYTEHDVQMVFEMIQSQGNKMLLFTQNVVKFSVSLIPEDVVEVPSEVLQLFQITKEPVRYIKKHGIKMEIPSKVQKEFLSEMSILKAAKARRTESLRSTLVMKTKISYNSVGSGDLKDQESLWLVSNCSEPSDISHHQLIVSGAAILLRKTEAGLVVRPLLNCNNNTCGIYFSFLPLPVECGFPFHLNGLFTLENSRRHLATKTEHDRDSPGGKWNQTLIKDSVCPSVIHTFREAVQLVAQESDLYSLLPVRTDEILSRTLTQTFWKTMINDPNAPPIFKGCDGWVTLQDACFLEKGVFNSSEDLLTAAKTVVNDYLAGSQLTYVDTPSEILDVMWKIDENFMKKKTITVERFFIDCFLPNIADLPISTKLRDRFLLYGLMMNSEIVNSAYCLLPCIPVCGSYQQFFLPNELIHPGGRAAKLYCVDDQRFPSFSVGSDTNLLSEYAKLCQLGMAKDILTWEDILERAEDIAQTMSVDDIERAKCLIEYLEWRLHCGTDIVPEEGIKTSLALTRFIPVMQQPEQWTVTWKGDMHNLCCGHEMLFNDKYLVGCSLYPIPNKALGLSRELALLLGMKITVPLNDTVKQLQTIADLDENLQSTLMMKSIRMIYTHLEEFCQNPSHAHSIASLMSGKKLVYIDCDNLFVYPSQCAFDLDFKASPLLYSLPASRFPTLFRTVGVKEQFLAQDYMQILSGIKEEMKEEPLCDEMLGIVIKILQQVKKEMQNQKLTLEMLRKYGKIYMPDTKKVLYPSGKMTYLDCPWVKVELPYLMTNKCITYDVAKALGAKDIRSRLLSLQSQKLGTPFGQKEILLDRIRTVLKAYPFGTQILMEFAQNADDAGATELHFILDRRTHKKDRLIGDKWSSLQGPGLCVYNNGRFTNADLKGIIALGQGSKKDDPGKIGQHGVGLSAVYHMTDVQIIRVQMDDGTEHLIALDPTCQYVPGATSAEPGMLYSKLDEIRNIFPDVFSCFIEDKYKGGTFFRFPLHQKTPQRISGISRDIAEINKLLDTLKDACTEALLFLTSLKEIHITKISENGSVTTESITASVVKKQSESLKMFKETMKREAKKYAKGRREISDIPYMQVSYTLQIKSSTSTARWIVVQQLGTKQRIPEIIKDSISKSKVPALPIGGAAYLYSETKSPTSTDHGCKPKECMVYTSLPLPLKTNLPVNINGHFVLDHESRQHLWGGRGDEYKTQWNEFLCGNVIASCYATCILLAQKRLEKLLFDDDVNMGKKVSDYFRIFPQDVNSLHCHESKIVESTCELIAKLKIVPVPSFQRRELQWCSLQGESPVCFYQSQDLPLQYCCQDFETDPCDVPLIVNVADLCSIKTVHFPNPQVEVFQEHLNLKFLMPSSVLEILQNRYSTSDWIPRLQIDDVHNILGYCMKDPEFPKKMNSLPLLVTSDGHLRAFSASNPVFKSPYTDLVAPVSGEFLHTNFIDMFRGVESQVFKDFKIPDFAHHLALCHPELVCKNNVQISFTSSSISERTLGSVWEFIMEKSKSVDDIQSLDNLCLLRVQTESSLFDWLYPLKLAYTIIPGSDITGSFTHFNQADDIDMVPWLKKWKLVADWDNPSSIAKAFRYHQTNANPLYSISPEDLLSYFSRKENLSRLSDEGVDDLKHLKIFPAPNSKCTLGTDNMYVIPASIPKDDMDTWMKEHVFLEEKTSYNCLYKKLGFHFWTKKEVYINFIIPQMELGFSKEGYWKHMEFMVREFCKEQSVLDHLQNAEIVQSTDGTLHAASELFSPSVHLFRQMESEECFPERPPYSGFRRYRVTSLNSSEWETFLASIGLICDVSEDKMYSYVQLLSQDSKKKCEQTTLSKSREIIDYIFSLKNVHMARNLLRTIRDVSFLPQEITQKQWAICPPLTADSLVPLDGSVVNGKYADLVWSVARVIPNWFISKRWKELQHCSFDIIYEPDYELVVDHMKCVCLNQDSESLQVVSKRPKVASDREKVDRAAFLESVLKDCFNFLEKKYDSLNASLFLVPEIAELACIFVPHERKMVKPAFCFLDADDSDGVSPYLFKIPDYMKDCRKTLMALGCVSKPSTKHYQAVLQQIYDEHGPRLLPMQQVRAAKSAMDKMFRLWPIDIDIEKPLYFLSETGRLVEGQELVFNNNSTIRERLLSYPKRHFLARITTIAPVELILNKLPESHRPKILTSIVKEGIHDISPVIGRIQKAVEIEQNLRSDTLIKGVQRMAKHIASHEGSYQSSVFYKELTTQICSILQKIRIIPVDRLRTVITDYDGHKCGDVSQNTIYIDQSTASMYVHKSVWENKTGQTDMYFWMLLAEMINKRMQGLFKEYKDKLMVILATGEEAKIKQLLDSMGIAN